MRHEYHSPIAQDRFAAALANTAIKNRILQSGYSSNLQTLPDNLENVRPLSSHYDNLQAERHFDRNRKSASSYSFQKADFGAGVPSVFWDDRAERSDRETVS